MRRPTPPIGAFLRTCSVLLVGLTTSLFKIRRHNLERIPAHGGVILAVNHVSYVDPLLVSRFVWDARRVPRFLAKGSLFRIHLVKTVMRHAGQIPVERGTRDAAMSLAAAVEALRAGELIVVYPEGTVTRDPDFWPMIAKTGLARLALLVPEAAVIPVGQWGAQHSIDVYHKRYRPLPRKTVTLSVGEPVDLSRFRGAEPTAPTLRAITDTVMVAVRDQVAAIRGVPAPKEFSARPKEHRSSGEAA